MDNADFENGVGDWKVTSNVSTLTTDTTAFLHNHALKIVASGTPPITSVLQLAGTSGIQINLNGDGTSRTFRAGGSCDMDLGYVLELAPPGMARRAAGRP